MSRENYVGGGHVSGQLSWLHFGLGDQTSTQMRVIWPDGTQGSWTDVAADTFYDVTKDEAPKEFMPK
jgi:hypothetical protein